MSKRSASENLKSFSWIYIVVSILYIAGTIIFNVTPELKNSITKGLGNDAMLSLNIAAGVVVVLNLWYFWLCRRVADGKSEGILYMILLILGIVSSLVSFFTTKGAGIALTFDAVIDLCGLYFLMQARKEK
jgi:hypothetical protein